MTRKSSPLIYNDYLYICAQSLATAKETPSDLDLVFHLEVAREAEKAYTFFNYTDIQQTQFMGEQQVQVYLNAFSVKVQDWRFRFLSSLTQDCEYNIETCSTVKVQLTTSQPANKSGPGF